MRIKLKWNRKMKPLIYTIIILLMIILPIVYLRMKCIFFTGTPMEYDIQLDEPLSSLSSVPIGVAVDPNKMRTNSQYLGLSDG